MATHADSGEPPDVVDELTAQLLACGAVLSQIISHMVRNEAAGRSAPDAAPIPEVAHTLLHDVLADLPKRRSRLEIRKASAIVAEATEAISENIFLAA
jgi:hypothetical protein